MISISVEVDGIGSEVYTGKKLDRKLAIKKFCEKHNIKDIDSLRHYPRVRLVKNGSNKNKK
jgi:hypothetical protein